MANVRAREQMPEKEDPLEQLRQESPNKDPGWMTRTHEVLLHLESDVEGLVRFMRLIADRVFGELARTEPSDGHDENDVPTSGGGTATEINRSLDRLHELVHELRDEVDRLERL